MSGEFLDLTVSPTDVVDVQVYPYSRSLHLILSDGSKLSKLILKRRPLTYLLHDIGVKVRDLKEKMLLVKNNIPKSLEGKIIRAIEIEPGVYYAVRVTSPEYVPVPHTKLFNVVSDTLGIEPARVRRFAVRTVAYWKIASIPIPLRDKDELTAMLMVSNANTGRHSIKIYGWYELLACANGMIASGISSIVRITHRSSIESILDKVKRAVIEVKEEIADKIYEYREAILQLNRPIPRREFREYLERIKETVPKRDHGKLNKLLREYLRDFGYSYQTLFQLATYFASRTGNYHAMLKLSKLSEKLLATAIA